MERNKNSIRICGMKESTEARPPHSPSTTRPVYQVPAGSASVRAALTREDSTSTALNSTTPGE